MDIFFFFYSFVEQKIKEIRVLWSVINSSYMYSLRKNMKSIYLTLWLFINFPQVFSSFAYNRDKEKLLTILQNGDGKNTNLSNRIMMKFVSQCLLFTMFVLCIMTVKFCTVILNFDVFPCSLGIQLWYEPL